jgi:molybdopterin-binding protein
MNVSAQNRLKGRIVEANKGATSTHLPIDVGGTIVMTSSD